MKERVSPSTKGVTTMKRMEHEGETIQVYDFDFCLPCKKRGDEHEATCIVVHHDDSPYLNEASPMCEEAKSVYLKDESYEVVKE
jgi:hypothetical protein